MPRRNRNRRGRSRRSRAGGTRFSDWIGGVENIAGTTAIKRSDFAVPTDRNFRITGIQAQFCTVTSGSACFQMRVYGPYSTSSVWCSGPLVVGSVPIRRYFRIRPSNEFPSDIDSSRIIVAIDQICQTKSESDQLRFVIRVDFSLSNEMFTEACPKLLGKLAHGANAYEESDSSWGRPDNVPFDRYGPPHTVNDV